MTNKGQAVTNPRISAGATTVKKPTSPLGVWFRANFHKTWRAESSVLLTSSNHINATLCRARYRSSLKMRASAQALGSAVDLASYYSYIRIVKFL